MQIQKPRCERCAKYQVLTIMQKRDIEIQEVKEKIRKAKIDMFYLQVYIGYDYFECPICHWFKFILKR